jgi:hypothetical protein
LGKSGVQAPLAPIFDATLAAVLAVRTAAWENLDLKLLLKLLLFFLGLGNCSLKSLSAQENVVGETDILGVLNSFLLLLDHTVNICLFKLAWIRNRN